MSILFLPQQTISMEPILRQLTCSHPQATVVTTVQPCNDFTGHTLSVGDKGVIHPPTTKSKRALRNMRSKVKKSLNNLKFSNNISTQTPCLDSPIFNAQYAMPLGPIRGPWVMPRPPHIFGQALPSEHSPLPSPVQISHQIGEPPHFNYPNLLTDKRTSVVDSPRQQSSISSTLTPFTPSLPNALS